MTQVSTITTRIDETNAFDKTIDLDESLDGNDSEMETPSIGIAISTSSNITCPNAITGVIDGGLDNISEKDENLADRTSTSSDTNDKNTIFVRVRCADLKTDNINELIKYHNLDIPTYPYLAIKAKRKLVEKMIKQRDPSPNCNEKGELLITVETRKSKRNYPGSKLMNKLF